MRSPSIIIPGAQPVAAPGSIIQTSTIDPLSSSVKLERKQVSEREARDQVEGNPYYQPWAVVVPYTQAFHVDLELHHTLCFMRAPDTNSISAHVPALWERHVVPAYPRIFNSTAEVIGSVEIMAIDEGDWRAAFLDVHRKFLSDSEKFPLYALGGKVPFFFTAPWLDPKHTGYAFLRSWWSDNQIIGG